MFLVYIYIYIYIIFWFVSFSEHSILVKTEDDPSTVINPSSIISPPLEYGNDNENQINSINQKWPSGDYWSSANTDFYDIPSLPRSSLTTNRSSG